MPKSKHRRKPGGKAVAHPGRGQEGRAHDKDRWIRPAPAQIKGTTGLPLFDWAANADSASPKTTNSR